MTTRKAPPKVRGVYEREPGSGVWWICYKQGTVRKREKVGRRSDAITLYQQRKTELRAGAKLAPNLRTRGVTFAALAAETLAWSEEHHPKDIRTVKSRMALLVEEFGAYSANSITPQIIDRWLTEHRKWAGATKNRYRALISLVYRLAMKNSKASNNPARAVEPRAESKDGTGRCLTDREEQALRAAMAGRYDCHLPALDVALHTGMRLSEQFSLTWDQVSFGRKEILLSETKNGSSRYVKMNAVCIAALKFLAKDSHQKTDRVFKSVRGDDIDNPRAWFKIVLEEAKIGKFRWHDLRHTFCSRLAMAGVDIRTIAQLAGHKTLAMAMRYSHLSPSHNQDAIEKLVKSR